MKRPKSAFEGSEGNGSQLPPLLPRGPKENRSELKVQIPGLWYMQKNANAGFYPETYGFRIRSAGRNYPTLVCVESQSFLGLSNFGLLSTAVDTP